MKTTFYISEKMKSKKNFVLWKLEEIKGRQCKIPYSANYDGRASSTNPKNWCSYDKAVQGFKTGKYGGIGFVFDKDVVFVDLDHCIKPDGTLTELSQNIVRNFSDTTIEVSQSGAGLHIFVLGNVPKAVKTESVEMYSTGRYVALTGHCIQAYEPVEAQERIDTLYKWLNRNKPPESKRQLPQYSVLNLSEQEIIDKAAAGFIGKDYSGISKIPEIKIPGLADGGCVPFGTPIRVNERGTELIGSFNNRAAVLPPSDLLEEIGGKMKSVFVESLMDVSMSGAFEHSNSNQTPTIVVQFADMTEVGVKTYVAQREASRRGLIPKTL